MRITKNDGMFFLFTEQVDGGNRKGTLEALTLKKALIEAAFLLDDRAIAASIVLKVRKK